MSLLNRNKRSLSFGIPDPIRRNTQSACKSRRSWKRRVVSPVCGGGLFREALPAAAETFAGFSFAERVADGPARAWHCSKEQCNNTPGVERKTQTFTAVTRWRRFSVYAAYFTEKTTAQPSGTARRIPEAGNCFSIIWNYPDSGH
jgi:hypothetical protein